jgi:hypothetical protein
MTPMDHGERQQWLALLKTERDRRAVRVEWQAGEAKRAREQFIDTLQQMAQRMAATVHLYPLLIDDMAPARDARLSHAA